MIVNIKSMIERCIRRMRRGECETCDHREACAAARWRETFADPEEVFEPRPRSAPTFVQSLFPAFLGAIAKALEKPAGPGRKRFRREVEQKLEPLLATGDVGIDRIARDLGCSRQTLYRRLKAEGVTFEQVRDELRHGLALRLVRREGLGVKQAAYRLGFSDPATFSRAFKRWTGYSPSTMPS
jgi:AraC-like DNA-binding protein